MADARTSELLEAALSYARRGWRVLPLHNPTETGACSCGKADCGSPGKHPRTKNGLKDATTDEATVVQWWQNFPLANVGILTGAPSGFFVLDVDARHGGDDSLQGLRETFGAIPATVGALTGTGEHIYFAYPYPSMTVQNSAGKLGDGLDVRGEGGYVVAPPSLHPSGRLYAWEGSSDPNEVPLSPAPLWLLNQLRASPARVRQPSNGDVPDVKIPQGSRNNLLTSMAGTMRRRGFAPESILAALNVENETKCTPPLDPVEVRTIAWSVGRYSPSDPIVPGEVLQADGTVAEDWPKLPEEALYGLAGDVVRGIDPYTEADKAAILAHFLVFFGNCVGPSPHFRVGGDEHPAKLFVALVGDSSTGRKGTSEGQVRHLFKAVDPDWTKRCFVQGLASGEGLIRALAPEGASADSRAVVVEPEMANVLAAMGRLNSTLSSVIRQAWDKPDLAIQRAQTKNTIKVYGVHVSMVTHITPGELLRRMDSSENSNGFANRFLWFLVRGSKMLPDAPQVPQSIFDGLERGVVDALDFGRRTTEMRRSPEAAELWREIYPRLRQKQPGLVGLVTSRGEAQVLRLSMIYALLDRSHEVLPVHIRAALALFDFTSECARQIFGGRMGDPIAQRILEELDATENGRLQRSDLIRALGGNVPAVVLENSLTALVGLELVRKYRLENPPGQRGPKPEMIVLVSRRSDATRLDR